MIETEVATISAMLLSLPADFPSVVVLNHFMSFVSLHCPAVHDPEGRTWRCCWARRGFEQGVRRRRRFTWCPADMAVLLSLPSLTQARSNRAQPLALGSARQQWRQQKK